MKTVILKNRKSWKNYYCYLRKNAFSKRAARQQITCMKRIGVKWMVLSPVPHFFNGDFTADKLLFTNSKYIKAVRNETNKNEVSLWLTALCNTFTYSNIYRLSDISHVVRDVVAINGDPEHEFNNNNRTYSKDLLTKFLNDNIIERLETKRRMVLSPDVGNYQHLYDIPLNPIIPKREGDPVLTELVIEKARACGQAPYSTAGELKKQTINTDGLPGRGSKEIDVYHDLPVKGRGRTEAFIHEDDYQRRSTPFAFKAHELTEKDRTQGYSWTISFSAVNPDDEADDTAFKLPG